MNEGTSASAVELAAERIQPKIEYANIACSIVCNAHHDDTKKVERTSMSLSLLVTIAGPLLGAIGRYTDVTPLFWIGTGLCVLTLGLNMMSGASKLPILPAVLMVVVAAFVHPWYVGAAVGLLAWTALESVGELIGLRREGRL